MFWDRTNRFTGVTLLILAVTIIVSIILSIASMGDSDPFERDEISSLLQDINDNDAAYFIGLAFGIATDAVFSLAAGALLYILLRDRNRSLALLGFAGVIVASAAFIVGDVGNLTLGILAEDFVEKGGPGGIQAGDAVILEVARSTAIFSVLAVQTGFTALGFGFLAFGSLITWAPAGGGAGANPPRYLGPLALLGGASVILSWTGAAVGIGFLFFIAGNIAILLWLLILGGWLLTTAEEPARGAAPASA